VSGSIDRPAQLTKTSRAQLPETPRITTVFCRLYDLHALIPRLGLFAQRLGDIPYDYDELLGQIAPRPTLLYTPRGDRDATFSDVEACVNASAAAWPKGGLTRAAPDAISKMESDEARALRAWVKATSAAEQR
jgi:hypothetical protein